MSSRYVDDATWLTCLAYFDGACAYCGCTHTELTGDHLIPKSQGGHDEAANIVPACETCNQAKANKEWRTFMMSMSVFSQERMNKIFAWRRICKLAKLDDGRKDGRSTKAR